MEPDRTPCVTALIVEDDAQLLEYLATKIEGLELAAGHRSVVHRAADLASAENEVDKRTFDLVLLDLNLPDSEGLDTLLSITEAAPGLPVVVVTGGATAEFVQRAVLAGAADCLIKGDFGGAELERTLRVTVSRARRDADLIAQARQGVADPDTGSDLARHASATSSVSPPRLLETFPEINAEAVERYRDLVRGRSEERGLQVDYQVSGRSRELAGELGRRRASPRDLVDVHQEALADLIADVGAPRRQALVRSAESVLVETMGHLAIHYRTQSLGMGVSTVPCNRRRSEM